MFEAFNVFRLNLGPVKSAVGQFDLGMLLGSFSARLGLSSIAPFAKAS